MEQVQLHRVVLLRALCNGRAFYLLDSRSFDARFVPGETLLLLCNMALGTRRGRRTNWTRPGCNRRQGSETPAADPTGYHSTLTVGTPCDSRTLQHCHVPDPPGNE